MIKIKVETNDSGQRLDRLLKKLLPNIKLGELFKMIRKKTFKLNGKRVSDPSLFVKEGDILSIYLADGSLEALGYQTCPLAQAKTAHCYNKNLKIIHEDENILVINKPAGLLTHPVVEGQDSAVTRVHIYLRELCGSRFRPATIGRLDRNTSGLLVFAKNYESLKQLNALMRARKIKRYYQCLVEGSMEAGSCGRIDAYIKKDTENNVSKVFSEPRAGAKRILSEYKVLENRGDSSLLQIQIITGRSHQIRASLAYIGYPILGDIKYGANFRGKSQENGLKLHCSEIIIENRSFKGDLNV